MRTFRGVIAVAAALGVLLLAAGTALAATKTQTASAPLSSGGTVSATLSYTPKSFYDANIRLTITRAGQQLFSATLAPKPCTKYCLVGQDPTEHAVHAVDLQGNGEPVVFVDFYTGGAHCCSITRFYTYDPGTQAYRSYEYGWGDPGYRLETIGGKKIFETDDDRFAYAFTDFAASGLPLQLLSFDGTKLVDVTTQYPALIAKNAAQYLAAFKAQAKSGYSDTVGEIAAWAADEDLLGKSAMVSRYLTAQAKLGHLKSGLPGSAGGLKFVAQLDRFLRQTGYLK